MKQVLESAKDLEKRIQTLTELHTWFINTFTNISVQDDVDVSISEYGSSVTIHSREDLQTFMNLAPQWRKSASGRSIAYTATVNDREFTIYAMDSALPSTCRVVTETRYVPPREGYTDTTERVVCDVK